MTVGQFAALTGLNTVTVTTNLCKGRLNGVRLGSRWEIPVEEYERYLADGLLPPPEAPKRREPEL